MINKQVRNALTFLFISAMLLILTCHYHNVPYFHFRNSHVYPKIYFYIYKYKSCIKIDITTTTMYLFGSVVDMSNLSIFPPLPNDLFLRSWATSFTPSFSITGDNFNICVKDGNLLNPIFCQIRGVICVFPIICVYDGGRLNTSLPGER